MKVPYAVRGGLFMCGLILIIFVLKVTCPVSIGCFADPFLVPILSPLLMLKVFGFSLGNFEPLYIILFWTIIGILFGYFYSTLKTANSHDEGSQIVS
jgi:hypothetical protein